MKISSLNRAIINSMLSTGTVIECKEGYMLVPQRSLSEPSITISIPSDIAVGEPAIITITASDPGTIIMYINQEYVGSSEDSATYTYEYTPEDSFTVEAFYNGGNGISAHTSSEVDLSYAVQSLYPQRAKYNPVFQEYLYDQGIASNPGYTTMEEASTLETITIDAFQGNTSLTHMDELRHFTNVTSIEDRAFEGCTGLTSITIPNSVTSIGTGAFYGCTGLTSITIPNSVTSIGDDAFYGCTGLTNVTIPNSVTSIEDRAFSACTGLTSVTIPNSVTSIEDRAFSACTGLTSVTIPNSVTIIGTRAFEDCTGLTSVTIGNSVTSIGDDAFYGCTGLTSVTIPNSVTIIGTRAFGFCSGLTSITIGNGVAGMGESVFLGCVELSSIYSYPSVPPNTSEGDPFTVGQDITIYVPIGSGTDYRNVMYWSNYNIVETDLP